MSQRTFRAWQLSQALLPRSLLGLVGFAADVLTGAPWFILLIQCERVLGAVFELKWDGAISTQGVLPLDNAYHNSHFRL